MKYSRNFSYKIILSLHVNVALRDVSSHYGRGGHSSHVKLNGSVDINVNFHPSRMGVAAQVSDSWPYITSSLHKNVHKKYLDRLVYIFSRLLTSDTRVSDKRTAIVSATKKDP